MYDKPGTRDFDTTIPFPLYLVLEIVSYIMNEGWNNSRKQNIKETCQLCGSPVCVDHESNFQTQTLTKERLDNRIQETNCEWFSSMFRY